jgi:hypothetical protein
VTEKAWLYLNGQPVVCTRQMEVAAMVSSINPAISATIDSVEMGALQQVSKHFMFDSLIKHLYSAHIHFIECSWHLADVLACSQKVSHSEMRLVSPAIGASFQLWCTLVSVCFHNLVTYNPK